MALLLIGVVGVCGAQAIQLGGFGRKTEAHAPHVMLLTDQVAVGAGRPQDLELIFRVEDGFHINSHTPMDGLLLPTRLTLDGKSVHVLSVAYPKGAMFRLQVGAGEDLSVYQGEFRVAMRVVAPRGASMLRGELHYQACDRVACYPPKTIPVQVGVTGK